MASVPTGRTMGLPRDSALPFVPCRTFGLEWFEQAPVRFDNAVELPVSRDRLFAVFADPASWSQWVTGIGSVEWTSPEPFGVGTTRTVTLWGGVNLYEEFMEYDPSAGRMVFCFYGTTEPFWNRFGECYQVTELGPNRCRLDWTVVYDPTGLLARIHWLMAPLMSLALASYMWRLWWYVRGLDKPLGIEPGAASLSA